MLGKLQLTGIPPAARGVPQIEVTFRIDATGVLDVSAKDLATQNVREMRIIAAGGGLTRAEIEQALAQATSHQAEDKARVAWSKARNDLDALVYSTRTMLTSSGAKLPAPLRSRCEQAVQDSATLVEASTEPGNTARLVVGFRTLESAVHAATEALYSKR